MPQTINNFNEVFIGHNEKYNLLKIADQTGFTRSNSIHDITRPFLSIKSFNIDVAPTQGLMSFKTGKLSLMLHDRTRMVDIAPFIKPDLFGSFGAEIAIEYGWSHIDGSVKDEKSNSINYLGKFLDESRVTEKYIITNSSYSMDNTGQINIELSIAMRGPVDLRSVKIHSDPPVGIKTKAVERKERSVITAFDEINTQQIFIRSSSSSESGQTGQEKQTSAYFSQEITSVVNRECRFVVGTDTSALSQADFKDLKKILGTDEANMTRIKNALDKIDDKIENVIAFFNAVDPPSTKVTDPTKKYILGSKPIFSINGIDNSKPEFTQKVDSTTYTFKIDSSKVEKLKEYFTAIYSYLSQIRLTYIVGKLESETKKDEIVKKIVGGLDKVDPFYNTDWLVDYTNIISKNPNAGGQRLTPISGLANYENLGEGKKTKKDKGKKIPGATAYVSLGSFITGLVGTHMSAVGKFDEIQIVSYTCNENCGLFSNYNASSLLIPREGIVKFLNEMFKDGATFTLESIISQVINEFINTRTNICYGLKDLYKISDDGKVDSKYGTKRQKFEVDKQLNKIYTSLAAKDPQKATTDLLEEIKFVLPKIKVTFDTLTSKESAYDLTISRISIFDQNDNPFGSINKIMKNFTGEKIITAAAKINKERAKYEYKYDPKKRKKGLSLKARERFYKKSWEIIQNLTKTGVLVETPKDSGNYEVQGQFLLEGFKNNFKSIMPSITYGTQNSAIIEASVSTVNEAKLNTVYLTRSDRAADEAEKIAAKVSLSRSLPLRVLPSQASITIFGCPFVNFAQYIFLDFETGTTVDNAYAITGIKHDLSPGKFTTQLTLSYGDVYGKYEAASNTLARSINEVLKPKEVIRSDADYDIIIIRKLQNGSKPLAKMTFRFPIPIPLKFKDSLNNDAKKVDIPVYFICYKHNKNYVYIDTAKDDNLAVHVFYKVVDDYRNISEKQDVAVEDIPTNDRKIRLNLDVSKNAKVKTKIDIENIKKELINAENSILKQMKVDYKKIKTAQSRIAAIEREAALIVKEDAASDLSDQNLINIAIKTSKISPLAVISIDAEDYSGFIVIERAVDSESMKKIKTLQTQYRKQLKIIRAAKKEIKSVTNDYIRSTLEDIKVEGIDIFEETQNILNLVDDFELSALLSELYKYIILELDSEISVSADGEITAGRVKKVEISADWNPLKGSEYKKILENKIKNFNKKFGKFEISKDYQIFVENLILNQIENLLGDDLDSVKKLSIVIEEIKPSFRKFIRDKYYNKYSLNGSDKVDYLLKNYIKLDDKQNPIIEFKEDGLHFEIITGVNTVKRKIDKKKKTGNLNLKFVFTPYVISWKDFLDGICEVSKLFGTHTV